jgi:hypothetical protein
MDKAKNPRMSFLKKVTFVFSLKAVLSLIVLVNAVNIIATTMSYQAVIGGAISVASNLSSADKGFSKASSGIAATGTLCATAAIFGLATTATPGVTAGDLVYDLQVNSSGTPANTCWQVSFVYTPSGGAQATLGPIVIGTVVSSGTIDCKFDVGASAPNSPFSYKVSVV